MFYESKIELFKNFLFAKSSLYADICVFLIHAKQYE